MKVIKITEVISTTTEIEIFEHTMHLKIKGAFNYNTCKLFIKCLTYVFYHRTEVSISYRVLCVSSDGFKPPQPTLIYKKFCLDQTTDRSLCLVTTAKIL